MTLEGRPLAIVGVGYSRLSRGDAPLVEGLAIEACRGALTDAGLEPPDVDGLFEIQLDDSPSCFYVQRALGIPDLAAFQDLRGTGPSGLASAMAGMMAVGSGACDTALVYRALTQVAGRAGQPTHSAAGAPPEFLFPPLATPYGYWPLIPLIAMMMQRRFAALGGRPEDYGELVVSARRWAALNGRAVKREPLALDDYLASRYLAEPMRLMDCDLPINGATAVIITTAERARDLRQRPVYVDAYAFASGPKADWILNDDFLYGSTRLCAQRLWRRSSLTPADVDVAQLYDGFTHLTLSWIEALGFCGPGEAGDFVQGGSRIGPGGELPLNTSGGQLAEGRLFGLGLLSEAVLQLRGVCQERQVPDARVAVVTNGHGPLSGAVVLRT